MEENIIKATCKELGLTYAQLADRIGYGEGAVKNSASAGKISETMQKAIELYVENQKLQQENSQFKSIGTAIDALIQLSKS